MRSPGVHVVPPRKTEPIAAAAVDVPAFVGMAERGPIGAARAVEGWPGFRTLYGDLMPNAQLAWAVRAFFENGGRRCHVVRVAAAAARTTTDPASPQPADRASSIVLDTAGFATGAAVFITQDVATAAAGAQPADRKSSIVLDTDGLAAGSRVEVFQLGQPRVWRSLRSLDPVTKTLGWDEALPHVLNLALPIQFTVRRSTHRLLADVTGGTLHWQRTLPGDFSPTKPMAFATGAAEAEGVFYDEMGQPVLRLAAASPGAFGNAFEVRLARTVSAEVTTRRVATPDAPDALSVSALVDLVPGAIVTLLQDGAPTTRRRLRGLDTTARRALLDVGLVGFDLAGAAVGSKPIRLRRETFALSVYERGRLVETHTALDLPAFDPTHPVNNELTRFNERSRMIRATRLDVSAAYPLPDPAAGPGPRGRTRLVGGRDGVAALRATDLIAGLAIFEPIDEPAAVAVPDGQPEPTPAVEVLPPPATPADPCALDAPPPALDPERPPLLIEAAPPLTLADLRDVQLAMILHCELRGDRVAVLDAPRDKAAADPFDPHALRDWRVGLDSRFAALYWPWLQATDPNNPRGGLRALPPSGHVLGAFARSDLASGVQKAPANSPLDWAQAVTRDTDETRRALLNDAGINVIRALLSRGIRIYGARTLAAEPDHRQLNARRTLIQLRRTLRRALAWVVFEPDNLALRALLRTAIESFLDEFWQRGALSGATRDEAFRVAFDPPGAAGDGVLVIHIAVALVHPAEFVVLTLTRTNEALDFAEPTAITEAVP